MASIYDSPADDFSFTAVIINSTTDHFLPNISGEIHPVNVY
jgi:hypothetical protein